MISRVTNQTVTAAAHRNLQAGSSRMAALQQQASDLKKITKPSDDPGGTAAALAVRSEMRNNDQYARNIGDGNNWLGSLDSAMSLTHSLLVRARDLTVQGANASMSAASKEAIAVEVAGIRADLLAQANTKISGRTVFAGNSDAGAAFADGAPPVYTGTGSPVERRIADGDTLRVDGDGAAIFGTGNDSVFAVLDKVVADLRGNGDVSSNLTTIDTRLQNVIKGHSEIGARHARLIRAEEQNMSQSTALEGKRAGIEDVDLAETIVNLKAQEINYQASLAVTARVLQPSLMDFLK